MNPQGLIPKQQNKLLVNVFRDNPRVYSSNYSNEHFPTCHLYDRASRPTNKDKLKEAKTPRKVC